MFKTDPIFWGASAVFVLMLALFAGWHYQYWLALLIIPALLRPTMASLGAARKYVDERQMSLHYRSGNVGFAVTLLMCVFFLAKLELEENHDFEYFAAVIVVGVAAKALFHVVFSRNYREGATKIILVSGLMIALFSIMDARSVGGMLISALPGLAVAGIGLLSIRYPRPVGILSILAAGLLILLMVTVGQRNSPSWWGLAVGVLLIGVPLVTAGVCLLLGDPPAAEEPGMEGK